jgi:asparagine synthase (glutamine-hydrolysing)
MFEWANRVATAFSIEDRHPFADRRLVEFCLALPAEQKLSQGWTRFILRQGMAGILPPSVQWRGGKTVNRAAFIHAFSHFGRGCQQETIATAPGPLEGYVNLSNLRQAHQRYLSGKATDEEILIVWQAVTLALWLRHTNLTP